MYLINLVSYLLIHENILAVCRTPGKFCVSPNQIGKKKKKSYLEKFMLILPCEIEIQVSGFLLAGVNRFVF